MSGNFKLNINPSKVLNTPYGTARINNGYYIITTNECGNYGKKFHRLIWEEHNGSIPNDCIIHHKDKNKLNNCIHNLEIMTASEHMSLHSKGKHISKETKEKISKNNARYWKNKSRPKETIRKISESKNNVGFQNVSKVTSSRYSKGYYFVYRCRKDGYSKKSVDIFKLKRSVEADGYGWNIINLKNAIKTVKGECNNFCNI